MYERDWIDVEQIRRRLWTTKREKLSLAVWINCGVIILFGPNMISYLNECERAIGTTRNGKEKNEKAKKRQRQPRAQMKCISKYSRRNECSSNKEWMWRAKNPYKFYFFFYVSAFSSAQNALMLLMNHTMMSHNTMWRRKDTFVFPRWQYECEFVCFACFLCIFFSSLMKRFIDSNDNTTQYFVLVYYVFFSILMFSFIFHSCYHGSTIFAHENTTIILFQFLCQHDDKFIKWFLYLELELGERFK